MSEREMLQEALIKLARLEEKIDAMKDARDKAMEALASTKSAHLRINEIEDDQKWLWRTTVAAVVGVLANLFLKFTGKG